MTTDEVMNGICASLEYRGESHELYYIGGDLELLEANIHLTSAFLTAVNELIQTGEVEAFTLSGEVKSLITMVDMEESLQSESTSLSLRFVGEAKRRAEQRSQFRHELHIQDSTSVPYLFVDSEARELSARSNIFQPPTTDSFWWETRFWWRPSAIPVAQILSGDWRDPVVLPMRVTYPYLGDSRQIKEPFRITSVGRLCAVYSAVLDYYLRPGTDLLILVGRLPDDILSTAPVDGVYVWGSIRADDHSPFAKPTPPLIPDIGDTPLTSNTDEPDPMIGIGSFPADETAADFIASALGQAGIGVSMRGSRAYSIEVRASKSWEAIRIIWEDSQKYGYWVNLS